eukprot:3673533-Prymnesium_polylepis.1
MSSSATMPARWRRRRTRARAPRRRCARTEGRARSVTRDESVWPDAGHTREPYGTVPPCVCDPTRGGATRGALCATRPPTRSIPLYRALH